MSDAGKTSIWHMVHSAPMAMIRPFRALRYDSARVSLEKVVTQPYDKISSRMREAYLAAHPNNLVRILRPLDNTDTPAGVSPYEQAARTLAAWRQEGVLGQIAEPALFAYYQRFRVPGTDEIRVRKGFIGLTRLADYTEGVVFPHERTLSRPRADRLELLRHTRTHFGPVFLMYSDPSARIEAMLDAAIDQTEPVTLRDENDVEHSVWTLTSPEVARDISNEMLDKKLLIADGHHRYETALAFRDEERRRASGTGAEWLMTTLVNMDSRGLVVLPTHRVLANLAGFEPSRLVERVQRFYEVHRVGGGPALLARLRAQPADRSVLGVVAAGQCALLVLRDDFDPGSELGDLSAGQAGLSVVLLHRLVLERCLGLTEKDIREESYVKYVRDPTEAMADVQDGRAQACFLLNATPVLQVRDVAFSGEILPQKSTDFFPKLLSGLAMYVVE
jgi:uncharacterized protein (DUF1015 family)